MKLRTSLALLVLSASIASAQTFTGAAKSLADADAAWEANFHAGKLDQLMEVVAADALVYDPNMPVVAGKEKIAAAYKEMLSVPGLDFSWHALHVVVSGDMGFTDGAYSVAFTDPQGKPFVDKGKYVTIWHRDKAGKWWVIRDIYNSDMPMPK